MNLFKSKLQPVRREELIKKRRNGAKVETHVYILQNIESKKSAMLCSPWSLDGTTKVVHGLAMPSQAQRRGFNEGAGQTRFDFGMPPDPFAPY